VNTKFHRFSPLKTRRIQHHSGLENNLGLIVFPLHEKINFCLYRKYLPQPNG